MSSCGTIEEKFEILNSIQVSDVSEILLNFFIKMAMTNCFEKEDIDMIKRSLYLLKKIFIIQPNTKIKIETIKKVCETLTK
jgi:hypothetical protein